MYDLFFIIYRINTIASSYNAFIPMEVRILFTGAKLHSGSRSGELSGTAANEL